jgi:biotin carboxyl carrier protein
MSGADPGADRRVRVTADPATDPAAEPVVVGTGDAQVERRTGRRVRVRLSDGSVVEATVGEEPAVDGTRRPAVEVVVDGWRFVFVVEGARRADLRERASRAGSTVAAAGPVEVRTPIPGRVVSVSVAAGDSVDRGQPLLVVEAMKMQNEVRAPRAGAVRRVDVEAGRPVDAGDLLVVIE